MFCNGDFIEIKGERNILNKCAPIIGYGAKKKCIWCLGYFKIVVDEVSNNSKHPSLCQSLDVGFRATKCHTLRCERGVGVHVMSGRLYTLCSKQVQEFEYPTLIKCSTFYHIRLCFPHIFDQTQSSHEFISQSQCALSIATFIGEVLKH